MELEYANVLEDIERLEVLVGIVEGWLRSAPPLTGSFVSSEWGWITHVPEHGERPLMFSLHNVGKEFAVASLASLCRGSLPTMSATSWMSATSCLSAEFWSRPPFQFTTPLCGHMTEIFGYARIVKAWQERSFL
jgi:hypothetical protein